jgi:CRISPR-associated protein Csx10
MYGFAYTLELLEPVMANSLGGDANSAQSLKYVPGALIRGAIIDRYRNQRNAVIDAGDEEARRLFFDGRTRYLHAYPLLNRRRGLPAPLAWHQRKNPESHEAGNKRDICDLSINPGDRKKEYEKGNQMKGLEQERFCFLDGERALWTEVGERLNVHTQRDADVGRATEDAGAVFRYEALPAGLKLKGIVVAESEDDAKLIKDLLDGQTIRLGKSRTAGYGAALVTINDDVSEGWREADNPIFASKEYLGVELSDEDDHVSDDSEENGATPEAQTYGQFILTTLSDTIVRDDDGQHTLDPLPALRRKLGSAHQLKLDEERSFRKAEIVGGFNRKWGLPLPQVAAIAAGSTFAIKLEGAPLPPDVLREWQNRLQDDGIGERRVEGFGRVVVEWYYTQPNLWVKAEDEELLSQSAAVELTPAELVQTRQMLRRLLRRDLDRKLAQSAHRLAGGLDRKGELPNSQLSRWRGVIYSAMGETGNDEKIRRVTLFISREEEKRSQAWEKLRRARITSGAESLRLTDWVRQVLTDKHSPWNWLMDDWNPETKNSPSLKRSLGRYLKDGQEMAAVTVVPNKDLAVEYRLRLIESVLALAAKP